MKRPQVVDSRSWSSFWVPQKNRSFASLLLQNLGCERGTYSLRWFGLWGVLLEMARRHGWELPAHSFQIIAITVYFLLCIAYYAFFAPFLGKGYYEYVVFGVYSFSALFVFLLYVRCTAIDPADPGILVSGDEAEAFRSQNKVRLPGQDDSLQEAGNHEVRPNNPYGVAWLSGCSLFCGLCCICFVKEDCRRDENIVQQQASSEDALFCTLCNAEVHNFSKHCGSCDKCVDGFDHHCLWLNNCIGRKNYMSFLLLMAASLIWLVAEASVGIAVLVRCFTHKQATDALIKDKLGNGFSRPPFAAVVGLTTYEYVVAMRTQSEPPGPSMHEDQQSLPSSPISSAVTAMSVGSSLGLQYRGAWCTPPRIFVDHQDEVVPHLGPGRVPSTVDPDTVDMEGKRIPKRPVRISAWKLAKLDSNEAVKAAARARASSSVLRSINHRSQHEADRYSSDNMSCRSSAASGDIGLHRDMRMSTVRSSPVRSSYPPSHTSREDLEMYPQTPSTFGSPHPAKDPSTHLTNHTSAYYNPVYTTAANRSPFSRRSHDGNDSMTSDEAQPNTMRQQSLSIMQASSNASVYWDREAGRFVSAQNGASSSHQLGRSCDTELLYSGQSIFFGGPLLADRSTARNPASSSHVAPQNSRGVDRRGGSHQLPVFVPSTLHKDMYRMPPRD